MRWPFPNEVAHVAHAVLRNLTRHAARNYVAGGELGAAIAICRRHRAAGRQTTVCYWNRREDAPEEVFGHACAALATIRLHALPAYLSVKAPALAFDVGRVDALAALAREAEVALHFDAMDAVSAVRTRPLAERARAAGTEVGWTLPGRWRRSLQDADWAVELGLRLRLVKGQWADPAGEEPPAAGMSRLAEKLAGRSPYIAVATHDAAVARACFARLLEPRSGEDGGPRAGQVVLEQLHGLRPLGARAVPFRFAGTTVYVPFGQGSLPYALFGKQGGPAAWSRFAGDVVRSRWDAPREA